MRLISQIIFLISLLVTPFAFGWNTATIGAKGSKFTKWTWTGAGGNASWDNGANWCGTYLNGTCKGQPSGPPDDGTAIVVFDDICSVHGNCNPSLPARAINLKSLSLKSGYSGTFDQAAVNLTLTTGLHIESGTYQMGAGTLTVLNGANKVHFLQTGGRFLGGAGAVTVGSAATTAAGSQFLVTGGEFVAPSSTLSIAATDMVFQGLSAFNPGSGSVEFYVLNGLAGTINIASASYVFNNLSIIGRPSSTLTLSQNIDVSGDLTLSCTGNCTSSLPFELNNMALTVRQGNVIHTGSGVRGTTMIRLTGTGAQTVDATAAVEPALLGFDIASSAVTGSVTFKGPFTFVGSFLANTTLGTVDLSQGTLYRLAGEINTLFDAPYANFPSAEIAGRSNYMRFGLVNVLGDVRITNRGGSNGLTPGVVKIGGNVIVDGFILGPTWLEMNGTGNQTIETLATSWTLPALRINKTSGTLSFINRPLFSGSFEHLQGNVTIPPLIAFRGYATSSRTIKANGLAFNDVLIMGGATSGTFVLADDLVINGHLSFENGNLFTLSTSASKTLIVKGNITTSATGLGFIGTAPIRLDGANQAINFSAGASGANLPSVEITASSSPVFTGTFKISGNFTNSSTTGNASAATFSFLRGDTINVTAGTMEFGDVEFKGGNVSLATNPTVIKGSLIVDPSSAGRTFAGNLDVHGNLSFLGFGLSSTGTINLLGSSSSFTKTSSTFPSGTLTIAKTSGQAVTLLSPLTMSSGQSLAINSGSLDLGQSTNPLTLSGGGALSIASGATLKLSGALTTVNGMNVPAGPYSSGTVVP